MALLWGLVGGVFAELPILSKREPLSSPPGAHQHPSFPRTVSRADWQTKIIPQPRERCFFQAQEVAPLQMANLNQIENLGQNHAATGGRVHDGRWLHLPASLEKSKRLRRLNPQPEPLI